MRTDVLHDRRRAADAPLRRSGAIAILLLVRHLVKHVQQRLLMHLLVLEDRAAPPRHSSLRHASSSIGASQSVTTISASASRAVRLHVLARRPDSRSASSPPSHPRDRCRARTASRSSLVDPFALQRQLDQRVDRRTPAGGPRRTRSDCAAGSDGRSTPRRSEMSKSSACACAPRGTTRSSRRASAPSGNAGVSHAANCTCAFRRLPARRPALRRRGTAAVVGKCRREQRHGHVVDRRVPLRPPFERAAMGVAVEDGACSDSGRSAPRAGSIRGRR